MISNFDIYKTAGIIVVGNTDEMATFREIDVKNMVS